MNYSVNIIPTGTFGSLFTSVKVILSKADGQLIFKPFNATPTQSTESISKIPVDPLINPVRAPVNRDAGFLRFP